MCAFVGLFSCLIDLDIRRIMLQTSEQYEFQFLESK